MSSPQPVNHTADYAVFGCLLAASAAIGVVSGILDCVRQNKNKGKEDEEESTVKKRNLSVWPAALSVIASSSAAPFVLGVPAEMYLFGTEFALFIFGAMIAIPVITHGILVRLHNLEITNMYEYLEFRYNKIVRSIASLVFALTIIIYVAVITYSPAISLSQVANLKVEGAIAIVGLIAIVYTAIGGIKGIIWVDAAQMMILLASILSIVIQGSIEVGGLHTVWETAKQGKRVEFNQLSANPIRRTTLWTQLIGGAFLIMVLYTLQNTAQKFLCLPSLPKVYITAYFSVFAKVTYLLLLSLEGLVIYTYFATCSPLLTGAVKTSDQLVPYFVVRVFSKLPGMTGLFLAALFSACLSTIAAGLNSLSAVTVMDIILPLYKKQTGKTMNGGITILIFKITVILYGILTTGLAYVTPSMGSGVLQIVLNLASVVGGPLLGLFIIGIYMPWTNSWGAGVGLILSLIFTMWMAVGGIQLEAKYKILEKVYFKPMNGSTCPHPPTVPVNLTTAASTLSWASTTFTTTPPPIIPTPEVPHGVELLYEVSYMWYSFIAVLVVLLVANVISLATGGIKRNGKPVDTALSFACCYKNSINSIAPTKDGTVVDENHNGDVIVADESKTGDGTGDNHVHDEQTADYPKTETGGSKLSDKALAFICCHKSATNTVHPEKEAVASQPSINGDVTVSAQQNKDDVKVNGNIKTEQKPTEHTTTTPTESHA